MEMDFFDHLSKVANMVGKDIAELQRETAHPIYFNPMRCIPDASDDNPLNELQADYRTLKEYSSSCVEKSTEDLRVLFESTRGILDEIDEMCTERDEIAGHMEKYGYIPWERRHTKFETLPRAVMNKENCGPINTKSVRRIPVAKSQARTKRLPCADDSVSENFIKKVSSPKLYIPPRGAINASLLEKERVTPDGEIEVQISPYLWVRKNRQRLPPLRAAAATITAKDDNGAKSASPKETESHELFLNGMPNTPVLSVRNNTPLKDKKSAPALFLDCIPPTPELSEYS